MQIQFSSCCFQFQLFKCLFSRAAVISGQTNARIFAFFFSFLIFEDVELYVSGTLRNVQPTRFQLEGALNFTPLATVFFISLSLF